MGDIGRIIVRCANCQSRAPMSAALGLGLHCNGDRPWLGGRAANEHCDRDMELLVRTASNAYFAQVVSALRLREPEPDPLRKRVRETHVWKAVQKITTADQLKMIIELQEHVASAVGAYPAEQVLAAIKAENAAGDLVKERPLRAVGV